MRNEFKLILKDCYNGNLDSIIEIIIGAIIKEANLRISMERSGISLNLLLAVYSFCGKHIALDKIQIVDMHEDQNFSFIQLENTSINKNENLNNLVTYYF